LAPATAGAEMKNWGDYLKNEEDEKLVPLSKVPTIFLSEMLAAVESIKLANNKGADVAY
jgi:hypothetical protein